MNKDTHEQATLLAQEGMILNRINIQVILQLLVEKGIITREEVAAKRDYIGDQPFYSDSLNTIYKLQQQHEDDVKFKKAFKRVINDTASDGEIKYVSNELDAPFKAQTK